ncbi:alpha carbonic anhydrase, partial [Fimicolochytrium jonesii]|uniref:alpha carbonic anhydrase n=1 Tax=Fimicolochytrium jonesii TaxID=1396493 RepID=UPI0022FEA791
MTWPTTCQTGKFQSPIDLTDPASLLKEAGSNIVKPTYTTTNFDATFKNIGTTIQVDIPAAPAALTEGAAAAAPAAGEKGAAPAPAAGAEGAASAGKQGYSTPNGTFFELKQFHFHTPSEHRKFGQMLPMEMHMVHTSAAGEIAVVAVMFEFADAATVAADTSRAFLTPILAGLSAIKTTGTTTQLKNFNFAALAPMIAKSKEWVYSGSLTTPPCSEGVIFNILDDTMKITSDEFLAFNSIIKFNSRLI